jgi:RNA polymerase sigma factor (sigma-70 family)
VVSKKLKKKLDEVGDHSTCLTSDQYVLRLMEAYPPLEPHKEEALMRRIKKHNDKKAIETLCKYNQRLVAKLAFRYRNRGLDLADLIQEGNLGLLRAIHKFDPSMGNKFSTVAWWWVHEAVTRAIKNKGSLVRIPVHIQDEAVQIQKEWSQGMINDKRMLSSQEISDRTGMDKADVEKHKTYRYEHQSLDKLFNESQSIGDILHDPLSLPPDKAVEKTEDKEYLMRMVNKLPAKAATFLKKRYGLLDGVARTRTQMAEMYRISDQRIYQMQRKYLDMLRLLIDKDRVNLERGTPNRRVRRSVYEE